MKESQIPIQSDALLPHLKKLAEQICLGLSSSRILLIPVLKIRIKNS